MIGLVPFYGGIVGTTPESSGEYQLKLATLFYEKLIHHWWRGTKEENTRMIDSLSSEYGVDPGEMASAWLSIEDVAPGLIRDRAIGIRRGIGHYVFDFDYAKLKDETGEYRRGYRGIIDKGVADEFDRSVSSVRRMKKTDPAGYHYEARAIACSAFGTALLWADLQRFVECVLITFNRAELLAAKKLVGDGSIADSDILSSPFELLLPSIRSIQWKSVFELRKEPAVSDLREWMSDVLSGKCTDEIKKNVMSEIWRMVDDLMPNPGQELAKGFLSNVPLPIPVNPFGIASSAKTITKSFQQTKKYRWAVMFHRINQVLRSDYHDGKRTA